MSPPCIQCGECCRKARDWKARFHLEFDIPFNDDGSCSMLVDMPNGTSVCSIYEARPLVCNTDKMEAVMGYPEDWVDLNVQGCLVLLDGQEALRQKLLSLFVATPNT